MEGWQIINDFEVADKGDDLGQITWNKARHVQQGKPIRPQVDPVEIIGHGPNKTRGLAPFDRNFIETSTQIDSVADSP